MGPGRAHALAPSISRIVPRTHGWASHGVQHKLKDKSEEDASITMSIDYCCVGFASKDDKEPVLVMFDHSTEAICCVDHTGVLPCVVKWCVAKLEAAGYTGKEITLKSDREPALMSLKRAVMATRTGITTPIESPVRQSKANGAMERAIRSWQGLLRTLKKYFEDKLKTKLNGEHILLQWLTMWSSDALNLYKVHAQG